MELAVDAAGAELAVGRVVEEGPGRGVRVGVADDGERHAGDLQVVVREVEPVRALGQRA